MSGMWGDPAAKYGMVQGPATNTPTGLDSIAAPTEGGDPNKLLGLANPLTALLVIGVIWAGAAAFSTTVRVGNSSAAVNLGKA